MVGMFERPQFQPTEKHPRDWGGKYASGGRDDCEHERVLSGEFFACGNPAWSWICPKCGRCDVCQFVDADVKPETIDLPRFAQLMLEHHGDRYWVDWLAKRNAQLSAVPVR
jgi:hypothetical protein